MLHLDLGKPKPNKTTKGKPNKTNPTNQPKECLKTEKSSQLRRKRVNPNITIVWPMKKSKAT